jgi:hypothetical protein
MLWNLFMPVLDNVLLYDKIVRNIYQSNLDFFLHELAENQFEMRIFLYSRFCNGEPAL